MHTICTVSYTHLYLPFQKHKSHLLTSERKFSVNGCTCGHDNDGVEKTSTSEIHHSVLQMPHSSSNLSTFKSHLSTYRKTPLKYECV